MKDLEELHEEISSEYFAPKRKPMLLWAKNSLLSALELFLSGKYFPLNEQKEFELACRVWEMLPKAFDHGQIVIRKEETSVASHDDRNDKKRKLSAETAIGRKYSGKRPDSLCVFGGVEIGAVENAKNNDIQFLEKSSQSLPQCLYNEAEPRTGRGDLQRYPHISFLEGSRQVLEHTFWQRIRVSCWRDTIGRYDETTRRSRRIHYLLCRWYNFLVRDAGDGSSPFGDFLFFSKHNERQETNILPCIDWDFLKTYKVIFVQAAGETVCTWSLRYVVEGPAYELWLKMKLDVNSKFDQRVEEVPQWISFHWPLKSLLEKSINTITNLKAEHLQKEELRFSAVTVDNLSSVINPSILKLVEEEDKAGIHMIGPFYD